MVEWNSVADLRGRIFDEISRVVVGKDELKHTLLLALFAGGHILIEGAPGTAKTILSNSFARAIGGSFKRIQLTPDMLPSDITGFYLYSPASPTSSSLIQGPIFANVVLADEFNRTTPRTQSALLEAMQERQVTIDKQTYELPKPFLVIGTQVGPGSEGTYPITDVQADRFMLFAKSTPLSDDQEWAMLRNIDSIDDARVVTVTNNDEIMAARRTVRDVHVSDAVGQYIIGLVNAIRSDQDVSSGPSPRASIGLFKCARVLALFDDRNYVIPDDVKRLVGPVVEHRILLSAEAEMDGISRQTVLMRSIESVAVPKLNH